MIEKDPLWYKDAVIYELHVRAFHDAGGNGMGNFRGLAQKLDYLQDLGVTAVWLLPFYPSPLKDDGYDIADYTNIHSDYGTLRDFRHFLDAAHERGLRVITELVINHTSDQHPWFQRARRAPPGSSERDFYVWSDSPESYKEARIIFQDFEQSNWTYDSVAGAYYWHRFYHHQPDLNFDNPAVRDSIMPLFEFWMDMGVDAMRLDAVPYLFEREGTNCENLPETHSYLKELRRKVDARYTDRMLLAEANQWPEDAVAYFGDGDECHMAFHFPVMPRMFMAIHMEDRFPIIDIMEQTPTIPANCQWGMFLRNHDELTLEMVTDEERDYMYRAYASDPRARINLGIRRRLGPLLGNNRRRIELMNGLLFSLPGTPVLYYGEEIGMGDNIYLGDRNSVRTPMQWSADRNAGFSRANPQKLYLPIIIDPEYHYEAINVEAQQNNPNSLLWWMKRLIALRKRYKAFGRGSLEFLHPANNKILAFLRRTDDECILVVANLSRFVQYVELDLSQFEGQVPIELFGQNAFPRIGELPYLLTLGPHSFYWFLLPPAVAMIQLSDTEAGSSLPAVTVQGNWEEALQPLKRGRLESLLPEYLQHRRWFGGKGRLLKSVKFQEAFRIGFGESAAFVSLIRAEYNEGQPETYLLPITFVTDDEANPASDNARLALIAQVKSEDGVKQGVLIDALADTRFCAVLLQAVADNTAVETESGAEFQASAFAQFKTLLGDVEVTTLHPTIGKAEQSNTSVLFGDKFILKIFRRLDDGVNPDLEIGRYLSETKNYEHTAPVAGAFEYRHTRQSQPMTLALLHGFVANEGDAWTLTLDALSRYFEHAVAVAADAETPFLPRASLLDLARAEIPPKAQELIGEFLESARLLGQRTAELHLALGADSDEPAFKPEPFTTLYQRSVYQSMRNLSAQVLGQLRKQLPGLPNGVQAQVRSVLQNEGVLHDRFRALREQKISAVRTRCHGDYHLGQVLFTGKDFVIIDFEGEPIRTISERRLKRTPLRDVAGMIRSFHYAAFSASFPDEDGQTGLPGLIRPEDVALLQPLAQFWYTWVSATFLKAYLATADGAPFIPRSTDELKILLDVFILEKAIYEAGYEMKYRPDWLRIPLMGILQLLEK